MARYQRQLAGLASPSAPFNLVYHEWLPETGPPQGLPVICVHGLTRNGRDFDPLAQALAAAGRRVLCPDIAGRGESDWLDTYEEYTNPHYSGHLLQLIAQLGLSKFDWVGTSMGGLIGMGIAALPDHGINRLVINDVGAVVPAAALNRIGEYVGRDHYFETLDQLEAALRVVHAPFGPLTDGQWRHLATHSARRSGDGYRLAYDPAIAHNFQQTLDDDLDLWAIWDSIDRETLVIRGAESDLLLPDTAKQMTERGPKAQLVEIEGCGHAPALMADDQINIVVDWLNR
ncbi:MAG: alpha/beta hydrolase [Pseudomonadota bacterium]